MDKYVGPDKEYTNYALLSFPTAKNKYQILEKIDHTRSFLEWGSDLFGVMMESQQDSTNTYAEQMARITGNTYYRFEPSPIPKKYKELISMDNCSKASINLLQHLADLDSKLLFNKNNKEYIEFFLGST